MIFLWGLPGDKPITTVRRALQQMGIPLAFLDQRTVLDTEVELSLDSQVNGFVRSSRQTIDLGTVTAAYLRPYESCRLPIIASAGPNSAAWRHTLYLDDMLWTWAELTPALVINRPAAMAANNSKPYQAAQIRGLGFQVPETLITTDPDAAVEFWQQHGEVVYKSISAVRSIVTRLSPEDKIRLDNLRWCPTQFQQYIHGKDYRVHVVSDEVFACEITSEADDYRYAARHGAITHISAFDLPQDIADRCRAFAAAMKLSVAGVDLRRTPEGSWYCFEVNPSPGFTYYQEATDQPIDKAIARLLAKEAVL